MVLSQYLRVEAPVEASKLARGKVGGEGVLPHCVLAEESPAPEGSHAQGQARVQCQ